MALSLLAVVTAMRANAVEAPTATAKQPITVEQPATQMPDTYKLNMMIRTTLIALNQANQTGNYSVLRDLGTPKFQAANSDAKLAEIFAGLRARKLDFSPLIFYDPKLLRQPAIGPEGLLRMTGYIPTDPQRILFDLGFERIGPDWRLSAIVIDVQPLKSVPPGKDVQSKNSPKNEALPAKSPAKAPAH